MKWNAFVLGHFLALGTLKWEPTARVKYLLQLSESTIDRSILALESSTATEPRRFPDTRCVNLITTIVLDQPIAQHQENKQTEF